MLDLSKRAGLPLGLDFQTLALVFNEEVGIEAQTDRHAKELAPVLATKPPEEEGKRVLYKIFRAVSLHQDRPLWSAAGLRYDITLIPSARLGREFPKTSGHTHTRTASELYQVIYGRTYALLETWEGTMPREALLVEAGAGESYVVPPGFGHVTINPFNQPLVLANVIAQDVEQDYSIYEKHHGGSYYALASELGEELIDIIPNPHLAEHPPLKKVRPRLPRELSFLKERPLYHIVYLARKDPKAIQILKQRDALGIKDPETFFQVIG